MEVRFVMVGGDAEKFVDWFQRGAINSVIRYVGVIFCKNKKFNLNGFFGSMT